jgi:DNA (cytosine-5)-methyltransferase 1
MPQPRVIDLFCGAGGLSLGAYRAGFDVVGSIDFDQRAIGTHKLNFPKGTHLCAEVETISGASLVGLAKGKTPDGIIGGPPCQGFSRMGARQAGDPRNRLFWHFFRLIKETKPKFFIAENVIGLTDQQYKPLVNEALDLVRTEYDTLCSFAMCASSFGVPTKRQRVFFIGMRRDLAIEVKWTDFFPKKSTYTTVAEAFTGLPCRVRESWQTEAQSWRKVRSIDNEYTKIINRQVKGVGEKHALDRFDQRLVSGFLGTVHSENVKHRYARLEQGKTDSISKAQRLKLDGQCPTLRAGTGPERGSYQAVRPIHPTEPRVITPREAARLQGFPDWFVFPPTKWHSFRQIGNSVSPLVSEYILRKCRKVIE